MSVTAFNPTDLSQSATNWQVAQRFVTTFAPHAQLTPNMTIALDPGFLLNGVNLIEVNAQSTSTIAAPASGFRIDRVVVDRGTGLATVVAGTISSLTPPAIPAGKLPIARVMLESTCTAITNSMIIDERALSDVQPQVDVTPVCFRATMNGATQSIPSGTWTKLNLTAADINVGNGYDTTSVKFQPTVAGCYQVNGSVNMLAVTSGTFVWLSVYKNGVDTSFYGNTSTTSTNFMINVSDVIYLNGTTDYLELFVYQNSGSARNINSITAQNFFSGSRVG